MIYEQKDLFTCSVVRLLPQAYSNKIMIASLVAIQFHTVLCLLANRKGMVISMKKIISVLLTAVILLGLAVPASAATLTPNIDQTTVQAGDTITVKLTLDDAISNVGGIQYRVYYDTEKFDYVSGEAGDCISDLVISKVPMSDAAGTYRAVTYLDTTSTGKTIQAGVMGTFTFRAKSTAGADTSAFRVTRLLMDPLANTIEDGTVANSELLVSITPAAPAKGYSVMLSQDKTIACGDNAQVTVQVVNSEAQSYNAFRYVLTYDTSKLTYVSATGAVDVSENNGTITIIGYGEDKTCGTDGVTLMFTGKAVGDGEVKLTAANVDIRDNANVQDAPQAAIFDDTTVISVSTYTVTLPNDFSGEETAAPNSNYTFTAKDNNYTYNLTATMGGVAVEVKDNGNGTFTIEGVEGNIIVTLNSKTPKSYKVTVNGTAEADVTAETTATYGTDYTFTVTKAGNYNYDISATVGGNARSLTQDENGRYTIQGADIQGAIVITANKTLKPPTSSTITFTGEGSGDVVGGTEQTAPIGQPFSFSITKEEGYNYIVKVNSEELKPNEDGIYTIPGDKIDGTAISVTIEKTVDETWNINVTEYVNLDGGKTVFLVYTSGDVLENRVLAYDGEAMFWSEKYQGYAWLVISSESVETVKTDAKAVITIANGTKTAISYDGDINGTKVVDVNDAQLIHDLYNAKYPTFETVTMERFLRADVNGSMNLSVEDAAAVVSIIKGN